MHKSTRYQNHSNVNTMHIVSKSRSSSIVTPFGLSLKRHGRVLIMAKSPQPVTASQISFGCANLPRNDVLHLLLGEILWSRSYHIPGVESLASRSI